MGQREVLTVHAFFRPVIDHPNLENASIPKLLAHYTENERFPPAFPSSLPSTSAFDIKIGHCRGRSLGPR